MKKIIDTITIWLFFTFIGEVVFFLPSNNHIHSNFSFSPLIHYDNSILDVHEHHTDHDSLNEALIKLTTIDYLPSTDILLNKAHPIEKVPMAIEKVITKPIVLDTVKDIDTSLKSTQSDNPEPPRRATPPPSPPSLRTN